MNIQPGNTTELVRYDAMCRAIDAAYEVDEVKDIRDKALAIEVYAKQAKNTENERRACEIRLRAERKAGQLLQGMEKAKGGRPSEKTAHTGGAVSLADLGISDNQSSKWQKLADVPDDEFEAQLARPEKPSTNGVIRSQWTPADIIDNKSTEQPVSAEALWVWGRLRDFERTDSHNLLSRQQSDVLATMTLEMLEDTRRLAPLVAGWLTKLGDL